MQELKALEATAKLRVCAYARVSTDNEEQLSSYQAQVEHYTSYIKTNPAWEFIEVYSNEGIRGTNTKKLVFKVGVEVREVLGKREVYSHKSNIPMTQISYLT